MTKQTIYIIAKAHYSADKSTIISAKIVKEADDRIYFRASKRAVAAAERIVGLAAGDYLDFSSGAINSDGDLVGDVSKYPL